MSAWRMAWRNLWRNSRRTVVTMAAMGLALWVMVLYSGLVAGVLVNMAGDVLDFEVGDIQIYAQGYRDAPSLYTRIEDADTLVPKLEQAGFTVDPRLIAGGLAAAGDASAGVQIIGIDVARDEKALRIHERIKDGEWLDPSDPKGVVLGTRIARNLGVHAGDEVIVLSQAADGSPANDLYTVRGVLTTVGDMTDRSGFLMTQDAFRQLMVVPTGVHQLIVRVPEGMDLAAAKAEIESIDGKDDVQTWRQIMPIVSQMLDSTRSIIYIVYLIVYFAIGILILNAMLMAVFERIREFGVMKAIGTGPGLVFRLLIYETALETLIAVTIALLLAWPAGLYLAHQGLNVGALAGVSMMGMAMPPVWTAHFDASTVVAPVAIELFIVAVSALYPALKAARIQPLDAIHYH